MGVILSIDGFWRRTGRARQRHMEKKKYRNSQRRRDWGTRSSESDRSFVGQWAGMAGEETRREGVLIRSVSERIFLVLGTLHAPATHAQVDARERGQIRKKSDSRKPAHSGPRPDAALSSPGVHGATGSGYANANAGARPRCGSMSLLASGRAGADLIVITTSSPECHDAATDGRGRAQRL